MRKSKSFIEAIKAQHPRMEAVERQQNSPSKLNPLGNSSKAAKPCKGAEFGGSFWLLCCCFQGGGVWTWSFVAFCCFQSQMLFFCSNKSAEFSHKLVYLGLCLVSFWGGQHPGFGMAIWEENSFWYGEAVGHAERLLHHLMYYPFQFHCPYSMSIFNISICIYYQHFYHHYSHLVSEAAALT